MARYDLNVWDRVGHMTSYQAGPGWQIDVYECDDNWERADMPVKVIKLNDTQAEMLTLGIAASNGGDYTEDSDFFIDPNAFLDTYKNIPRKVRRYLEELDTTWED